MQLKFFLLSILFLLSNNTLFSRNEPIDTLKAIEQANISYKMVNLKTGATVGEYNSIQCATPASVTKLITTATALELYGGEHRFETKIETNGYIENDTIYGDLIITGGVDPTLGSGFMGDMNFVNNWAVILQNKGIKYISGNIVANSTIIDRCQVPVGWVWEDMGYHYGAGCWGLSAYDNMFLITLRSGAPGTRPQVVKVRPEQPNMVIENELEILKVARDSVYVFSMPGSHRVVLQGGMPSNRDNYIVKCSAVNPPLQVVKRLEKSLSTRGIEIGGRATVQLRHSNAPLTTIYTNKSPELREIIRLTNFKSNNQYAEHIYRKIGTKMMAHSATSKASYEVVKNFWSKKGIDVSSLYLLDGCGLAPLDAFNANLLTEILVYMRKSKNWDDFYNSLPTASKEGTVGRLLRNTPLEGRARVKSGSLTNVQCFSGYITPKSGNEYAFTIMVNNYNCKRFEIRKIIEAWLVRDAK